MTSEQKRAIRDLVEDCRANAYAKGFNVEGVDINIPEKLVLIHSEVSEALEDYRRSDQLREETGCELYELCYFNGDDVTSDSSYVDDETGETVLNKPCGFPSELADIVIRVFELAGSTDVDLTEAIARKMEYNATRPYKHGGKKC